MNFVWKYIFLITPDLRSKFTPIVQFEWWDWRSRNQSLQDNEEHSDNFSKPVGKSRSRKYPQGFLKTIISYCLLNRQSLEFQKATHTCAFCFSLDNSCPFASGTSPKWINWPRGTLKKPYRDLARSVCKFSLYTNECHDDHAVFCVFTHVASIYGNSWNKRKRLHKKRVQLPQDWFGTQTWLPFHCFGTQIWQPWRHVKTHNIFGNDWNDAPFWSRFGTWSIMC